MSLPAGPNEALPSRTSIMVAAGRALGAREPDPAVRNPDNLAERLLGPEEIALIQEHAVGVALSPNPGEAAKDVQTTGAVMMMMIRTRYIDGKLEEAVRGGATQVVILGAGFDTRAYRFRDLLKDVRVFEVDSQRTQVRKRQRVDAALGGPPPNLTYVEIDFNHESLASALERAGYRSDQKTFFTWEGVSMYVHEAGIRETLRTIATHSAPGSRLVMDYTVQPVIDLMEKYKDVPQVRYLAEWGEPWVFGLPAGGEREYLEALGLHPAEFFPVFSPEAIQRYLKRADGSIYGFDPTTPRPQPHGAGGVAAAGNVTWYSLVELVVPGPADSR